MSLIKGHDTQPERILRSAIWKNGLRYRCRPKSIPGRPDLVFPKTRVLIFIDGCFWHGCPDHYVPPRTKQDFWQKKLRENVLRDISQTSRLRSAGWLVLRLWEHEVFLRLSDAILEVEAAVRQEAIIHRDPWRVVSAAFVEGQDKQMELTLLSMDDPAQKRLVIKERGRDRRTPDRNREP